MHNPSSWLGIQTALQEDTCVEGGEEISSCGEIGSCNEAESGISCDEVEESGSLVAVNGIGEAGGGGSNEEGSGCVGGEEVVLGDLEEYMHKLMWIT